MVGRGHDTKCALDVDGGGDAWTSGTETVSLRSTQMMGQRERRRRSRKTFKPGSVVFYCGLFTPNIKYKVNCDVKILSC